MTTHEWFALGVAGTACVFDLRSGRIPNALTFSAALLALLFHVVAPQGQGVAYSAAGLGIGLLVFFPLFALGAMGAGDVKLMAALGAWVGWHPIVFVALYGSVAGGVLGVGVALANNYLRQALSNVRALLVQWWLTGIKPIPALTLEAGSALRMPYALPIAVGLMVTIWRL